MAKRLAPKRLWLDETLDADARARLARDLDATLPDETWSAIRLAICEQRATAEGPLASQVERDLSNISKAAHKLYDAMRKAKTATLDALHSNALGDGRPRFPHKTREGAGVDAANPPGIGQHELVAALAHLAATAEDRLESAARGPKSGAPDTGLRELVATIVHALCAAGIPIKAQTDRDGERHGNGLILARWLCDPAGAAIKSTEQTLFEYARDALQNRKKRG